MPLMYFVLFKTTIKKTFWPYMKILSKNTSLLPPAKLKSSQATYPTSNAKSLACDTANEHALERHAAAVRQLSNGTNGVDLYIRIATVGNTIKTVISPMYDTYMSTPGNTAKPRAIHSSIQTAQVARPWLGANLQCICQHNTESAL